MGSTVTCDDFWFWPSKPTQCVSLCFGNFIHKTWNEKTLPSFNLYRKEILVAVLICILQSTGYFISSSLLLSTFRAALIHSVTDSLRCWKNSTFNSRDFGPYWRVSIAQLLKICWLHVLNANPLFHHIPKGRVGLTSGDCDESCSGNQSFVTQCVTVLEASIMKGWTWSATVWLHVVSTKFWPYHPNVAAGIETRKSRKHFSDFLSNFGKFVDMISSVAGS